jgi:hypothetical protein
MTSAVRKLQAAALFLWLSLCHAAIAARGFEQFWQGAGA